jgi:hypothetical protein
MPDIPRPDDPYGLIGTHWPEESESAYAATAETMTDHAAKYGQAAENTYAEASRSAVEWLGRSGERYAQELQIDAEAFTGHQVSAAGMAEQMTAAAGAIEAAKGAITEKVWRYSAVLDVTLIAEAQPENEVKPTSAEVASAGRAAIAQEYQALDHTLTDIGNAIESLGSPASSAPDAAPAAYTAAPDVASAVPAAVPAVEAPAPVTAALPSGAELPAAAVPAAPFSELDTGTPAPGLPPSLGQMPAAMPTTQTAPALAAPAPTAVPTAPAPAAMPSAPAPISTGSGSGSGASSSSAPTPASAASAPAMPLTLTPIATNPIPSPFPAPAMPAPVMPAPATGAASTELSAAPNQAQTRTPGSPAAATLFQAQQQAPAPAMPMMPAAPMPTAAAPVAPAPVPAPAPTAAPTATPSSTAAAPASPASTAGDAVRRDPAAVTTAAGLIAPGGTAEAPEPSYAAALPAAEALAHRTLATIRRQFVMSGWVTPIAVAVLAGDHGYRCVFSTADDLSIIPAGAGLPVGVTPLDRVPGLDAGAADALRGHTNPARKLSALLPGAAVIVSTAVTDADGESVHHQRETEAAEIASAGELLPTTPGRASWSRTRPEDAAAEILRLSLHDGDDPMDATAAKVRLWAARWENTPRTDYGSTLRRWLLADAMECVRLNRRLSDAAWCVDQLRELSAARKAA